MEPQKAKVSARRHLMEALRTQDILDIEDAIAVATPESGADNVSGDVSRASNSTASSMAGTMDLNRLLLETKKMYLSLMNHCKHLVKPLRRGVRRLDGPGIVTSLDCVYRAPATVQKMMLRDTREGERILRLMSNAALDAKKMFSTDKWEDVDRYLHAYASVLREEVVVELSNIRDTLMSIKSPHKDHVSPSTSPRGRSPVTDVSVSPSLDRRSPVDIPQAYHQQQTAVTSIVLSPPSAERRRPPLGADSHQPTPALSPVAASWHATSALNSPSSDVNGSVNILRQKLHQYAAEEGVDRALSPRYVSATGRYYNPSPSAIDSNGARSVYEERRRMQQLIAKQLTPEEFDGRQQVLNDEAASRVTLHRDFLQRWSLSTEGCTTIAARLDALILSQPFYSSPMRGDGCGVGAGGSHYAQSRRRYRFLRLNARIDEAPLSSATPSSVSQPQKTLDDQSARAAGTRRQLSYHTQQQVTVTPSESGVRSGAPSPQTARSLSSERDVAHALGLAGGSSAATSAEPSRTSSPVPHHPTGELHHFRPPLGQSRGGGGGAALFSPPMELLAAADVLGLDADEWTGRSFIQDKEAFSRGVELDVCYSRIQLHLKVLAQPRRAHLYENSANALSSTAVFHDEDPSGYRGAGSDGAIRVTLEEHQSVTTIINQFNARAAQREDDDLHPVRLGRWGMNRDPYTTLDRSPERVESAPGTARHHSEALSLKSPSPPSASDDEG